MNRRKFCILTTATGLGALCGWILPISGSQKAPFHNYPKLRNEIQLLGKQLLFGGSIIGEFDDLAHRVLQLLDGKHLISEVASSINSDPTSQPIQVSSAGIAMFCKLLDEANLLSRPRNLVVFSQEFQT